MDEFNGEGWDATEEFHPLYRLWANLPMDYAEFHERQRDDLGEGDRWHVPDVWR